MGTALKQSSKPQSLNLLWCTSPNGRQHDLLQGLHSHCHTPNEVKEDWAQQQYLVGGNLLLQLRF